MRFAAEVIVPFPALSAAVAQAARAVAPSGREHVTDGQLLGQFTATHDESAFDDELNFKLATADPDGANEKILLTEPNQRYDQGGILVALDWR